MKEAIKNCFADRGLFRLMRSPHRQEAARRQLQEEAAEVQALLDVIPQGVEVNEEDAIEDILEFALNLEDHDSGDIDAEDNDVESITE